MTFVKKVAANDMTSAATWSGWIGLRAHRSWGPAQRGGAFAPYKRFGPAAQNLGAGRIYFARAVQSKRWRRLSDAGTQKEGHAFSVSFFLVTRRGFEPTFKMPITIANTRLLFVRVQICVQNFIEIIVHRSRYLFLLFWHRVLVDCF